MEGDPFEQWGEETPLTENDTALIRNEILILSTEIQSISKSIIELVGMLSDPNLISKNNVMLTHDSLQQTKRAKTKRLNQLKKQLQNPDDVDFDS